MPVATATASKANHTAGIERRVFSAVRTVFLGMVSLSRFSPAMTCTLILPQQRRDRGPPSHAELEPGRPRDLPMTIWVTLFACAKPTTSSAMRRSPPGMVTGSPPKACASRSVSAMRSRSSSVSCRLRLVSM